MKPKLSDVQLRALRIVFQKPFLFTTWGGKIWSGLPDGINGRRTLDVLRRHNLIVYRIKSNYGTATEVAITSTGRKYLDDQA